MPLAQRLSDAVCLPAGRLTLPSWQDLRPCPLGIQEGHDRAIGAGPVTTRHGEHPVGLEQPSMTPCSVGGPRNGNHMVMLFTYLCGILRWTLGANAAVEAAHDGAA